MKTCYFALATLLALNTLAAAEPTPPNADTYLWLEDVSGKKAMDWVKQRNAESTKALASSPAFARLRGDLLDVLDSDARLPQVDRMGEFLYNFFRDKAHTRGLWRRTTLKEYRKAKPKWTPIIDLDALAKSEKENWVWHGANCLKPEHRHCMIALSRGGADANVQREFDLGTRTFVKHGFALIEAKSNVSWKDADTLFVGTDFGAGSMTKSSYPRIAKVWKRGTPISDAVTLDEGKPDDISLAAFHDNTPGYERDFISRQIDDYHSELSLLGKDGKRVLIDAPKDAELTPARQWLLIQTRSPWSVGAKTFTAGSLLVADFDKYLAGGRELTVLFEPTATTSLSDFSFTKNHLLLNELEDVASRTEILTPATGAWKRESPAGAEELSMSTAWGSNPDVDDEYFLYVEGYLRPATFSRGVIGEGAPEAIKHGPEFFDASKETVSRYFVKSKDGARVPYFVIAPKELKLDGNNPTALYGYGGFEVSLQPGYAAMQGRAWLSRGGVYVVANSRGGGEYGPKWHQAALKGNRLRAYEDFAAVAADLFAKKITSPKHLGIVGGSNGGLMTGNMLTLYPQLFAAVVSDVPLLDMQRYTHLSAGASWIAEYGDPDQPAEWAFIKTFSPYHNARKDVKYPPVLLLTSTRDDRVGPTHARKMAAKLLDFGDDVQFYENIEGGHGGAADHAEYAFKEALIYTFLWSHVQ